MRVIAPAELSTGWLAVERPGPDAILAHVAGTGHGRAWVDRWPDPAAVLVETGGNYLLVGRPSAVSPGTLRPLVHGYLAASPDFDDVLEAAFPDRARWDRIVYRFPAGATVPAEPAGATRILRPADLPAVEALSTEAGWVSKTWSGPAGLVASGHAYGAFVDGRLAAVTCTFFRGARHADAGVVTEPALRRRGLGLAAARAWCAGAVAAGFVPTWTTSTDNAASRRIAERLGLTLVRQDVLHAIGVEIPR